MQVLCCTLAGHILICQSTKTENSRTSIRLCHTVFASILAPLFKKLHEMRKMFGNTTGIGADDNLNELVHKKFVPKECV